MNTMRQKNANFIRKSLVGGLVVLLPLAIVGFFFRWIYSIVTDITSPVSAIFIRGFGWPQFAADFIGAAVLVLICFVVGNLVTTRLGAWAWQRMEERVMARLPGYRSVREVIAQILGGKEDSPFSRGEVARIWLYGRDIDVSVLGLLTSNHPDGRVSVFVPTGPNPTSGFIYHVSREVITLCPEIRVEQMMKVVVACGAGTGQLFEVLPEAGLQPGGRTELPEQQQPKEDT
ncbi:MAG: DUF502 domain-containing protein [Alcanivorax sp.]|nr:DUF502 domain-containing protein [Alcanivorax sp.]